MLDDPTLGLVKRERGRESLGWKLRVCRGREIALGGSSVSVEGERESLGYDLMSVEVERDSLGWEFRVC